MPVWELLCLIANSGTNAVTSISLRNFTSFASRLERWSDRRLIYFFCSWFSSVSTITGSQGRCTCRKMAGPPAPGMVGGRARRSSFNAFIAPQIDPTTADHTYQNAVPSTYRGCYQFSKVGTFINRNLPFPHATVLTRLQCLAMVQQREQAQKPSVIGPKPIKNIKFLF